MDNTSTDADLISSTASDCGAVAAWEGAPKAETPTVSGMALTSSGRFWALATEVRAEPGAEEHKHGAFIRSSFECAIAHCLGGKASLPPHYHDLV